MSPTATAAASKAQSKQAVQQWLALWFPGVEVQTWQLLGEGVTAQVIGVEYAVSGRRGRAVLRLTNRPVEQCWRESRLLNSLRSAHLPVAACHGVKHDGVKQQGHTTCMLLDWLPGKAIRRPIDTRPYVEQAAELMARIHATPPPQRLRKFATGIGKQVVALGAGYPQFAEIHAVLSRGLPQCQARVLLHADFWPGNLLYRRKKLTGIVDWSDAAAGCPLADVSNARFEIRWLWGAEAMEAFTVHYFKNVAYKASELARWDLVALLKPILRMHRWGLSDAQQRRLMQAVHAVADDSLPQLQ